MDGGIPLNKKTNARAAGPLPGVRGKLAIAAMALALALAPLGSYASAAAMPAEAGPVASDAPASDAVSTVTPPRFVDGETRPEPPVDGDDAADHTMTFYYCEPMGYEDPDYSHPSGIRLLKKRVVTGLKAGQVLDTRDYVEDIEGHVFFDAYPVKPVVSSDESQNYVELVYFKTMDNACTVNYYTVKGQPDAMVGSDDIAIEKMGSFTIDNQRFDQKIEGSQVAAPLEEMICLDTYPESIRLKDNPEDNVINVFYTPALTTLPGNTIVPDYTTPPADGSTDPDAPEVVPPAEDAVPPASGDADKPSAGGDAEATPPAGSDQAKPEGDSDGSGTAGSDGADGAESGQPQPTPAPAPEQQDPAPAQPTPDANADASGSAGGAEAAADRDRDRDPKTASELPQTGDALPAALVSVAVVVAASAGALLVASRRLHVTRR